MNHRKRPTIYKLLDRIEAGEIDLEDVDDMAYWLDRLYEERRALLQLRGLTLSLEKDLGRLCEEVSQHNAGGEAELEVVEARLARWHELLESVNSPRTMESVEQFDKHPDSLLLQLGWEEGAQFSGERESWNDYYGHVHDLRLGDLEEGDVFLLDTGVRMGAYLEENPNYEPLDEHLGNPLLVAQGKAPCPSCWVRLSGVDGPSNIEPASLPVVLVKEGKKDPCPKGEHEDVDDVLEEGK